MTDLVMPFVICKSNGGPHDDAAFVSGYRLGELAWILSDARYKSGSEPQTTIRREEKEQMDLIAMHTGWVCEFGEYVDDSLSEEQKSEWIAVKFKKTARQ